MALETKSLVFTDLVGSTELAAGVGPVAAEALRKEHFALVREACAAAGGEEVKNLGDGLMLAFGSISAAVDAAVGVQRAIETRNRRAVQRFEVRIGVAVGEVTAEDGDYFGEPVVQASRLCALALGGQVLATDVVRVLAGSTAHGFNSVGDLELKGLPAPVAAHEVVWSAAMQARMGFPARLRGAPQAAYVGRANERAELEAAWKATESGTESLVLLAGEPGIGKTRLASQHAFAVHEAGGTVLYGAVDDGLGVPYQPWIEALGHYVDEADEELLARYVAEAGSDLSRLIPALGRRIGDLPELSSSDAETERYLLLEAITRLLRAASRDNPVLVVIDDLHWADKPTLLVLMHLHKALSESAVQFVGTLRDTDLTPEHPLTDMLATLRREERVTRLALSGLDEHDLLELLRNASGQEPTADVLALAGMLERDTNGNPLFVAEVLRGLMEDGHFAVDAEGRWGLRTKLDELSAPDSVRDVVGQRVKRLGTEATRILSTAAVIGRDFELDLLAAVLDKPADELLTVLEAAMTASLITESGARSGGFRFIHALIAQALVDDLSAARQVQLHRQIASSIEALHGPELSDRIGSVARHLMAAGDDPGRSVSYARRAGHHALGALAPDEAARWFSAALDVFNGSKIVDPVLRCDLLADLGEAMRDAGQRGIRDQLVAAAQVAEQLEDGDRMARPLLATYRAVSTSFGKLDAELIRLLRRALAMRPAKDVTRALLLGQLALELAVDSADPAERLQIGDEALDLARGLGDQRAIAQVLQSYSNAVMALPLVERRRELAEELHEVSRQVNDPNLAVYTAITEYAVAVDTADRDRIDELALDLPGIGAAAPQPTAKFFALGTTTTAVMINGDLAEAERIADRTHRFGLDARIADVSTLWGGQMGAIRHFQGRIGELVDVLELGVERNPSLPAVQSMFCVALFEAGRHEEAADLLDVAIGRGFHTLGCDPAWSMAVHFWSTTARHLRHVDAAAALLPLLSGHPDAYMGMVGVCYSHSSVTLGLLATTLGDLPAAEAHFAHAAERLEAARAPVLLAYARLEWARALLDLGEPADHTRALLTQAAAAYRRHDCPVRAEQCEELLVVAG